MPIPTLILDRAANQTPVTVSTKTPVSWDALAFNNGPTSWWDSGTPQNIVMPWIGPYFVNLTVCWDEVTTGIRSCFVCSGTDVTDDASRVLSKARMASAGTGLESTVWSKCGGVVMVPQENSIYCAGAHYTGSTNFLETQFAHGAAALSIMYLGTAPHSQTIINQQSIQRSYFW